jgi:hypothetical protein
MGREAEKSGIEFASAWARARPVSGKETIMKVRFGKNLFMMELSSQPFAWFQGETERMRLFSLSLLFIQFSLFGSRLCAY